MTGLGKRIDSLEAIAEQVRRRAARALVLELAAELQWSDTPEEDIEAAVALLIRDQDRIAAWRREGLGEREIMRRFADLTNIPVEDLERECRAILER